MIFRLPMILTVLTAVLTLPVGELFAQTQWESMTLPKVGWRGPGFYLSWVKILSCWLVFLCWVRSTDWISQDGQEVKLDQLRWNAIVFGTFLAAFLLIWLIPYFWVGFSLLVIAYSVRRLPFIVRGVSAGLEQVPEALEEAARNLGASKARTIWRITVPLIAANLIAGAVLTFAFAMLEVSDSLILAQRSGDYPITKQIYILFTSGTGEATNVAAALGVYGMILLGGTMALASALLGRRLGAIFRA